MPKYREGRESKWRRLLMELLLVLSEDQLPNWQSMEFERSCVKHDAEHRAHATSSAVTHSAQEPSCCLSHGIARADVPWHAMCAVIVRVSCTA